ncbi:MAG TPA: twin-arginine translocase TatA/TatE family subunit [Acidimicrobiia bacterium]|nr:twin-arginine translocase TatA/TatE family subunit [Acidimicrobiia bacterium]
MFGLRGQELLIILLIVLLIFGARKLPDLARSLGSSAKEFRKGIEEGSQEDLEGAQATETDPPQQTPPAPKPPEVPDS